MPCGIFHIVWIGLKTGCEGDTLRAPLTHSAIEFGRLFVGPIDFAKRRPVRLGVVPDNLLERLALRFGILPPEAFESWFGIMLARTVMAATKLDIFEALAAGPLTADEVAGRCGTHPRATEKLLNALASLGCLRVKGERYVMRRSLGPWVLKDGKYSFRDQILLHYLEWRWWEHCEEYVRTGTPLRVHQTMTDEYWAVYQRGMRSGLEMPARWVARSRVVAKGLPN